MVKSDSRIYFVSYSDIIWIEAYDYYIKIHVKDRYFLLRDTLKRMEQTLPTQQFVRIHKSSIVNVRRVASLVPQERGSEYEVIDKWNSVEEQSELSGEGEGVGAWVSAGAATRNPVESLRDE